MPSMVISKKTPKEKQPHSIPAEREKLKREKAERKAEKLRIRAEKEAARAERELKKQQEEAEKEQRRKDRELRKKNEEEKKQLDDVEKEQRRKEKEAIEAEKELKRKERELRRQQEEVEKEQKRKEKEVAEKKRQLLLQKQATIMDRLFRRKESITPVAHEKQSPAQGVSSPSPAHQTPEGISTSRTEPSTVEMVMRLDEGLKVPCTLTEEEILRGHVSSWQEKWKRRSLEPFRRWGVRMAPKVTVYRELRLQGASASFPRRVESAGNAVSSSTLEAQAPSLKRSREDFESIRDCKVEDDCILLNEDPIDSPPRKKQCNTRWKLLQFDKSHRPAYYGTFSKLSSTVGPRHPLRKDPSLDYEVDSDEEWEEEDPGESLSDCEDKEEDVEKVDSELDEDAADGFVVPDGYLSENEGVHLEETDVEDTEKAAEVKAPCESGTGAECMVSVDPMVRKQQHLIRLLDNVTKHALQRNRPFLVSDLLERPSEKITENQTERLCFQALRMCVVAPNLLIGSI